MFCACASPQHTPAFHERPMPCGAAVMKPSKAAFSGIPVTVWMISDVAMTP
jgi:hypothetical protein